MDELELEETKYCLKTGDRHALLYVMLGHFIDDQISTTEKLFKLLNIEFEKKIYTNENSLFSRKDLIYNHWIDKIINNIFLLKCLKILPNDIIFHINKIYLLYEQQHIHYKNICWCENEVCQRLWNIRLGNGNCDLTKDQGYSHCMIDLCHRNYGKNDVYVKKKYGDDFNAGQCIFCERNVCRRCVNTKFKDGLTGAIICGQCKEEKFLAIT